MKRYGLLLVYCLLALPQSGRPLTNGDIVGMVKQGVSDAEIIKAVQACEPAFDTSPPERLRLVQARVSEDVIRAMIGAETRKAMAGKFSPGRDGVSYPRPISQPRPPYTDEARRAGVEGNLTLAVNIRKDGTVEPIKVISGIGYGLDESAIDTVSTSWRFEPAKTQDGTPVDVKASVEVTFMLGEDRRLLFDTMGNANNSYSPDAGWELGLHEGESWVHAIGFKPSASGTVSRYEIVASATAGRGLLNAWLRSDSGNLPGEVIDQFEFTVSRGPNEMRRAFSPLRPTLKAGKRYWLVIAPQYPKTQSFIWHRNNSTRGVLHAQGHDPDGPWSVDTQHAPTLRVLGARR